MLPLVLKASVLRSLWSQCSLVPDADDSREKGYGRYYTRQRPLTAAALKEAEGYRDDSPKPLLKNKLSGDSPKRHKEP